MECAKTVAVVVPSPASLTVFLAASFKSLAPMFSTGLAAMIIGVCPKTLQRWEKRGMITPKRTLGGHRRYSMADLMRLGYNDEENKASDQIKPIKLTLLYSRVSSHKQKKRGDLARQQQYLEQFCTQERLTNYVHITDTASGLNTKRSGLKKLFKLIKAGKVARVVVTFKDRLTRFGWSILISIVPYLMSPSSP